MLHKTRVQGPLVFAMLIGALVLSCSHKASAQVNVLYTFTGGTDGSTPNALVQGPNSSLYGTAAGGGANGFGVVFQLMPASGGGWTETVLYNFTGGHDGSGPNALVFGPDGNLYGTAKNGGNVNCPSGCGTVFQLKPVSGGWTLNVVHSFIGRSDGHDPVGVTFDSTGNIYGTTLYGGPSDVGVVYKLTPSSGSAWTETVLYSFTGGKDGSWPNPQLTIDANGNVFGTTQLGGVAPGLSGFGTAFELSLTSKGWKRTTIAAFIGSGARGPGSYPFFGLISDDTGDLYGTTSGGNGDCGNVYRMKPSALGGRWQFSVLHFFPACTDASNPVSVVRDAAGNLYSTSVYGGNTTCAAGCGTIFELESTSGTWIFTPRYSFTGANDGKNPSSLILDGSGNLYGTAAGGINGAGVVFELPAP